MVRNEFLEEMNNLLETRFGINVKDIKCVTDVPLTQLPFSMDAISMTYLFLEVQDKFKKKIKPSAVDEYKFLTVDAILEMLMAE